MEKTQFQKDLEKCSTESQRQRVRAFYEQKMFDEMEQEIHENEGREDFIDMQTGQGF